MKSPYPAGGLWLSAGCALCMGVALVCRLLVIRFDPNLYDEGLIALGAAEILDGRWPLVDFYTPYPPAAFFVLALIYKVFGTGLLVERGFSAALVALAVGLGFLLAVSTLGERSRLGPREALIAIFPMVVAGLLLGSVWITPQVAGALVFILLAANVLVRALRAGALPGSAFAGLILGVAALWRADLAFYAAFASGIVWLTRAPTHRISGFLAMAASAAICALPVLAAFVAMGGMRAFNSLFLWPLTGTYHATLPWPDLFVRTPPTDIAGQGILKTLAAQLAHWWAYFPCFGFAAAVWSFLRIPTASAARRNVALWLAITGAGFGIYAGGRSDFTHLIPLLLVSLAAVATGSVAFWRERLSYPKWTGLTLTLLAVAALVPTALEDLRMRRAVPGRSPMPFARTRGILAETGWVDRYVATVEKISQSTKVGEPIFSGSNRHDIFIVNDNLLYFVSERTPATYFWCLDAAVTTTAPVQAQMIQEIKSQGTRLAVRSNNNLEIADFHKEAEGSHQLDRWLDASFPDSKQIGDHTLQFRRVE